MKPTIYQPGRLVAVLVLGLFAGAVLVAPAEAHLGSFQHLTRHFYTKSAAKAAFYKKSIANAKFVNVGEKATDADRLDGLDSSALTTKVLLGYKGISAAFGGTTDFQTLAGLNLPAGEWLVISNLVLSNLDAVAARPTCRLIMGSTFIDLVTVDVDGASTGNEVQVSLIGILVGGGTVHLQCDDGGSGDIKAFQMRVAATNATDAEFVAMS